jgi:hypothetical protein
MMSGTVSTNAIGAMSRTKSKLSFSYSATLIAFCELTANRE